MTLEERIRVIIAKVEQTFKTHFKALDDALTADFDALHLDVLGLDESVAFAAEAYRQMALRAEAMRRQTRTTLGNTAMDQIEEIVRVSVLTVFGPDPSKKPTTPAQKPSDYPGMYQ